MLVAGVTNDIIHQAFYRRTLNSGFQLHELLTLKLRFILTAAGLVVTCILLQRLLVNELLEHKQ